MIIITIIIMIIIITKIIEIITKSITPPQLVAAKHGYAAHPAAGKLDYVY